MNLHRWDVRPLGHRREAKLYRAVIEADGMAATPGPRRARITDLACIVRGYAGLIIGPQRPNEARKTPERVAKLIDALERARRLAAGMPEFPKKN